MGMVVNRFDIFIVSLEPTQGSEIRKTRPCVVISPDEMNRHINTVIVAPMTSTIRNYPSRILVEFRGKHGSIVLDQLRAIDKIRLIEKVGHLKKSTAEKVIFVLQEMFAI
jgi:mRNA interferase MazF